MATEQTAQHTSTPWEISGYRAIQTVAAFPDGHHTYIGSVSRDEVSVEAAWANAAFIVRAVNAHDDLLAAAEQAKAALEPGLAKDSLCACRDHITYRALRDAIAKACGEAVSA